ncbi:MAG: HAMP domain-containing histidine kinase [Chloroflexi bacterium]|nr:HAMP domain-containing histidine kinase [Chloroflexota bacterium]
MEELRRFARPGNSRQVQRVGLPLGAVLISAALGLLIAFVWLSPSSRETIDLAIYLVASGIISIAILEVVLRSSHLLPALRFRPKLLVAWGAGLVITLANTIAIAYLMFVNADHDLPLLIAIVVFAGLLGLYSGYSIAGSLSAGLRTLTDSAEKVASGDLAVRVPVESNDELGELAYAFNQMASTLEEAANNQVRLEEGRKQLTAAISHDLRTPLASARVMLEALIDGVVDSREESDDYHRRLLTEVKTLSALVDDLFQLSLLDVGALRLDIQLTPLQELVVDTIEGMRPQAERKGLRLDANIASDLDPLPIDGARMRRVLMNLIQNAIRHTPEDGSVAVTANDLGDEIEFSVRDTGEGIAGEDVPRIWNRFVRLDDARERSADGSARSGLGLAIAKAIVETHGGTISVDSKPGIGSVFSVRLPKYNMAQRAP